MLGVPYHHQGRDAYTGLDCVGLVMVSLGMLGIKTTDDVYPRIPVKNRLTRWLEEDNSSVFERASGLEVPGDIRTFWFTRRDTIWHLAIVSERGIVHVDRRLGFVVEQTLDRRWLRRSGPTYRVRSTLLWQASSSQSSEPR